MKFDAMRLGICRGLIAGVPLIDEYQFQGFSRLKIDHRHANARGLLNSANHNIDSSHKQALAVSSFVGITLQ
jgi:hypothetical protein